MAPRFLYYCAYLLEEKRKGADSHLKPFLDILPPECVDFPVLYDDETLAYLKGSPMLKEIQNIKKNNKIYYDHACEQVPDYK